jgi:hypothetical protein
MVASFVTTIEKATSTTSSPTERTSPGSSHGLISNKCADHVSFRAIAISA